MLYACLMSWCLEGQSSLYVHSVMKWTLSGRSVFSLCSHCNEVNTQWKVSLLSLCSHCYEVSTQWKVSLLSLCSRCYELNTQWKVSLLSMFTLLWSEHSVEGQSSLYVHIVMKWTLSGRSVFSLCSHCYGVNTQWKAGLLSMFTL